MIWGLAQVSIAVPQSFLSACHVTCPNIRARDVIWFPVVSCVVIDSALGCCESRSYSRDTHPELCITKCTSIRR